MSTRSLRAYGIVPAIGVALAAPLFMLAYLQDDWRWAAALMFLPGIFSYTYLGPGFGVIQNVVDVRRRATATALLLFVVNFIGLGVGPPFVGWLIDQLTTLHFAGFAASCPGGVAPPGATPALAAQCADASALGTRQGILITLLFYFWAALHFLMASFGLDKQLREAQPGGAT
jgi:hypothetical protein